MRNLSNSVRKRFARLKSFPQVKRLNDATFILDPSNWIDNRLLADVPFEAAQLEYARSCIGRLGITSCVDIGANFGLYTVSLGLMPEIQSAIAVEPVSRNFNQLCGNVFANRLDYKVRAHRCALGAAPGTATIHINPSSTGVSRFDLHDCGRDPDEFTQSERVDIVQGDELLPEFGAPVFVKIDVEGRGSLVLQGMERMLSTARGVIQIETDVDDDMTFAILDRHKWLLAHRVGADNYFEKRA